MTIGYTHPTAEAAAAALAAHGFVQRDGYWAKPSKVDDWYGGYAVTAIVYVERRNVAAEYGGIPFYELRFA